MLQRGLKKITLVFKMASLNLDLRLTAQHKLQVHCMSASCTIIWLNANLNKNNINEVKVMRTVTNLVRELSPTLHFLQSFLASFSSLFCFYSTLTGFTALSSTLFPAAVGSPQYGTCLPPNGRHTEWATSCWTSTAVAKETDIFFRVGSQKCCNLQRENKESFTFCFI